ncbi:TIGR03862 family flavoprotein [Flexibacterium corallicola]|uniref:TIGR03862 family flavoprotein n=1 Tax=Flexibacterium corallicola TaxID=3037259 RepID=UPI00286F3CD9|nr:TIGR03862 family flavoprotein [Pseudovibrio sp. M1P-2-3]
MTKTIGIIGAGPAGLFAAELLAKLGYEVSIFDRMPSPARKFLMAGRGGLNLTHSEPLDQFLSRYHPQESVLLNAIKGFPPQALRHWCHGLEQPTFEGSSGRVFPESFKASPLLRAWIKRLNDLGIQAFYRHRWLSLKEDGTALFETAGDARLAKKFDAVLLAFGGGSWGKLGSDGNWVREIESKGIKVSKLRPSNCGFEVSFSPHFTERFAGLPLKRIAVTFGSQRVEGELMLDKTGLEGGAIYALSTPLRDAIETSGTATLKIDLKPDLSLEQLHDKLNRPKRKQSLSTFLRKAAGLKPEAIGLLRETGPIPTSPHELAQKIKSLPVHLSAPKPIERAISSAGGILFSEIDHNFMLKNLPGVFIAGEMLDWEAPTGGYLLQGVFATAHAAALGIDAHLK